MSAIAQGPEIAALSCGKPVYLVVLLRGPDANGGSIIEEVLDRVPAMPEAEFRPPSRHFCATATNRGGCGST